MAITDLLDRIPFSPFAGSESRGDGAPIAERTFEVEVPTIERVGIDLSEGAVPPLAEPPLAAPEDEDESEAEDADPEVPTRAPRPPIPSHGVAIIGALSLLSLALAVALALAVSDAEPAVAAAPAEDAAAEDAAAEATVTRALPAATYSAEPAPIPVDLLTRLEEASEEPLDVELSRLLDAIQHGFGRHSAQLEPTLRSYVYRMASRFEWNPDTFRVAVTAPDVDLAAARGALLERLFEDATAAGRLDVGTGVGPHSLTLVSQ